MATRLKLESEARVGPQEISVGPGSGPLFWADNKGLCCKPTPFPKSLWFLRAKRGKKGQEQVTGLL